ncbi:Light-regulated protein [Capsicum chinense]|uniref:UPA22 n=1 Tax=Capsicum annuum TaxID=4072 RepID=C8YZB4_CAPAN|nr:light-regulated protein, chloroplastic isoform X2 [Capsicum annuum]ACV71021.1 UPA22 [Capsicum annuum]PHU21334.1 Light-regulated protein [Capsicum chinense]
MQAALYFTPSFIPIMTPPKPLISTLMKPISSNLKTNHSTCPPIRATPAANDTSSTVDYSSMTSSVFPAEACETIGGEACDVEMYPETKPKSAENTTKTQVSESVDREYLEYNEPKTVFLGEACDDLGGKFCEAEYQNGVY